MPNSSGDAVFTPVLDQERADEAALPEVYAVVRPHCHDVHGDTRPLNLLKRLSHLQTGQVVAEMDFLYIRSFVGRGGRTPGRYPGVDDDDQASKSTSARRHPTAGVL